MRLRELNIKNFGQFHNQKLSLGDGINVIYGENESGKSTVHSFIRSMLFDMKRQRGRAARTDVYSQYEPRENPSYYAGTLCMESGGKRFRLERSFYKEDARSELVCETDGERLSVENGDLKMLLGGIGRSVYDNTISVGQMKSRTDEELTRALRNYMANYQGDGVHEMNLEEAVRSLKKKKKELEERQAVHRNDLEAEERQLRSRTDYVREQLRQKRETLEQTSALCKREMYHREVPPQEAAKARKKMSRSRRLAYTCGAAALLLVLICVTLFFKVSPVTVRAGLAVVILGLVVAAVWAWKHSHESRYEEPDGRETYIRKLQWNVEYLQQEVAELSMQLEDMEEAQGELSGAKEEPDGYEEEIEALELSMQMIADIAISMQREISQRLRRKISEILCELTDGRYRKVSMNERMEMELHTADTCLSLYQVSSGTVDQVYFALRMAVMEILCSEEEMPVLLDEIFAMYDERRMERALRWLYRNRGQVVLFTCQDREMRTMDRLGIPYRRIELNERPEETFL